MNILIVAATEEAFHSASGVLKASLTENTYTTYQVTRIALRDSNWHSSTALLCIADLQNSASEGSSGRDCEGAITESVDQYLRQGGHVFLIGSCSDVILGQSVISSKAVDCRESTQFDFSGLGLQRDVDGDRLWPDTAHSENSETFLTYDVGSSEKTEILVTSRSGTSSGERVAVVVQVESYPVNGTAILCGFRTSVLEKGLGSMLCRSFLSSVLNRLALRCQPAALAKPTLSTTAVSATAQQLTPIYIYSSDEVRHQFLSNLSDVSRGGVCKGDGMSLRVHDHTHCPPQESTSVDITVKADDLPVVFADSAPVLSSFDLAAYRRQLKTASMGRTLMYSELTTSTQIILNKNYSFISRIPDDAGVVFVAMQQTHGKGRRDNEWVSPLGCLLFSACLQVASGSSLARHLAFLQYMCSLAVVQGICCQPGYEDLDLRLKWPNDIYYGRDVKIGGVIVDCSSTSSQSTLAVVGCGVNVTNSQPTRCLNDIISEFNEKHSKSLPPLSTETVLALTLNQFERIIRQFQQHGPSPFLEEYYQRWLHGGSYVKLGSEADGEEVMIIGLDKAGFLRVRQQSGELISVQPDGNSFDMLHGLLIVRKPV